MIHTHYAVRLMNGGGLASGMYTSSEAYETADLARSLGPRDRHLKSNEPMALVRVETFDDVGSDGKPFRRQLRAVILEVLPGLSGQE